MNVQLNEIWVYLATSPLLGLTLTLLAYQTALWLHRQAKGHPLVNPVFIAVAIVVTILLLSNTPYKTYFDGAQFVHFLLGPATVALAIPLYGQLKRLVNLATPLLITLLIGAMTGIASAVIVGRIFGATPILQRSLAPKSVTTPIAMSIAEQLGGLPSLTAVIVIVTGIFGAVVAKSIFNFLHIEDEAARGFAMGLASHGVGTARAFQISEQTGAFAALGMGLNGFVTAIMAPLLSEWLIR
jgi:predicted murein hydrolase (TIGR00659 family)